jgi:cell division protein FtsB
MYRMTLIFVLILGLIFYCTSGIRAMSIQNESDHAQLDELRQTVADLSTKIEVLNETIRKGKLDLITN